MTDIQKARDYANQTSFNSEVVNVYNQHNYQIDGEDAKKFLLELSQTPGYQAEALKTARDCMEELAKAVFVEVYQVDPSSLRNLRKNWVQAGFDSAKQSYAKTGDPDEGGGEIVLGRILAKLVGKLILESDRGFREIMLRRAIDTAPLLTPQQINSLSVLSIMHTRNFTGATPREVAYSLNQVFSSYFGTIAPTEIEYSYMASSGVGTNIQLLGQNIFEKLRNGHRAAMRKSFSLGALTAGTTSEDIAEYLESDPNDTSLVRLREDNMNELLGIGERTDYSRIHTEPESRRNFRQFAGKQFVESTEFEKIISDEFPGLFAFLTTLQSTGALHFDINTIGYMLAKQELDLRFPGNDFLLPQLGLQAPTKPADE